MTAICHLARRFLLALGFAVLATPALAQRAETSPPAGTQWEYGVYRHYAGQAKRWVAGNGEVIESGKLPDFILRIGGSQSDVRRGGASEEEWNASVLNVLGRQGWELVGCQAYERSGTPTYLCYFKRPAPRLVAPPSAP